MELILNEELITDYVSASQKVKVLTEQWVDVHIFCPNCGNISIIKYPNNKPVADFFCSICKEDYELKSKKDKMGSKIVDGAYGTMIERLTNSCNPNFFLLNYDIKNLEVIDFLVIPKHFFVPEIIEKRKPLAHTAKRAGWVGCNILIKEIPQSGKIFYVQNKKEVPKENVLNEWKKTLFLRDEKEIISKGWLIDIMRCIDRINNTDFTLSEMYSFEKELIVLHPENKHVKDKIRQQLQFLRDKGYIDFVYPGHYRKVK